MKPVYYLLPGGCRFSTWTDAAKAAPVTGSAVLAGPGADFGRRWVLQVDDRWLELRPDESLQDAQHKAVGV
jgi:hypothetical protein